MENKSVSKRKKDKQSDHEDDRRDTKMTRRYRSRSRSREDRGRDSRRKRRHSRSRSPNVPVKQEKRREDAPNDANNQKNLPERKAKDTDMLNTRTGGAYIPPARLRMMQAQITDKSSVAYQRLAWEALKKSIHGHINKINVGNIGIIIKELLKENIVRGRGLLCRSVIQAQAASPTFTNVYAALVAAVNSRFPNIGELLLKRLVIQFKRGFKRNDKPTCISSASFIAHLVNQRVAHEILALELLTLLVESPTDDSVEVAIAFLKECGQKLTEVSSKGVNAIFDMLRNILHEGQLDKRVQYMIEVMFQVWKDGFKDHPALIEELELVPEEEQFTHLLMLDDATDSQDILNVFKFDEKYEENEQKYKTLSKDILGSDAESGDEDGSEESGSGESEDEEEQEGEQKGMTIIDNTETNLVALRRTIYLTINSSLDFEECAHKLMKMQLKPGQEVELCHMFLDCCAEQRTYEKFYGLLAQRFCNINRIYIGPFEEIFKDSYSTAHRLDTNRLRNVSKFFAHLLFTDSISWEVMECVKLNEEDTTSSSRIYIKILFQELAEYMGLKKLNDRLKDPTLQEAFSGIFPRDNPKNTRFSINFFTSIGLGGLTDELREHLKQMPKNIPAPVTDINVESESSSSSSSSSDSSSESSSSDSEEEEDIENKKKKSKTATDKNKSKQNNDSQEVEATNGDKNEKNQRWGHDGFYETYGENARRRDNIPERSEQNNFKRPRDRERRPDDERENRDERNRRDSNGRRKEQYTRDSGDKRQERERDRPHERSSDDIEKSTNERNKKEGSRYDKRGRSDRDEKRRDEDTSSRRAREDDRQQDKVERFERSRNSSNDDRQKDKTRERNDRAVVDVRNEDDDKTRNRNFEKDRKDKDQQRNIKAHEDKNDRYKVDGRNQERNSVTEKGEKKSDRQAKGQDNDKQRGNEVSERDNRNREQYINEKVHDDVHNKKRKTEDKTKHKDYRKDKESDEVERRKKNKDKRDDRSNKELEKHTQKGDKSKNNINKLENRSSDTENHHRREDKERKIKKANQTEHAKKNSKKSKKIKHDDTDEDSSTSESSSSDSSSDSSSESSSSESEKENAGTRYWDSFDINPKKVNKEECGRTPEMKEKRYEKRMER